MPVQIRGAKRKAETLDNGPPPAVIRNVRPRKVQVKKDAVAEASQSAFLKLPPELRNDIYRHTLVEAQPIELSTTNPLPLQPGILQVSRQVRAECINIYYRENKFRHVIRDFDSGLYLRWYRSSTARANCKEGFKVMNSTNWANLLEWARADFHKECNRLGPTSNGAPSVPAGIFTMVGRMKNIQGLSWKQVAANLEDVHKCLVAVNPAWA